MTDQSTAAMLPPRSLDQEGGPCRDCADCRHWRPATLAGLRDGSLVAVQRGDLEMLRLVGVTADARLQRVNDAVAAQRDKITAMLAAAEPPR